MVESFCREKLHFHQNIMITVDTPKLPPPTVKISQKNININVKPLLFFNFDGEFNIFIFILRLGSWTWTLILKNV